MSEIPSDPTSSSTTPKGIGSLAKKQSDVTRQGTQKLKFTPTLPVRRKKDEVKPDPTIVDPSNASTNNRGRGRGGTDSTRGRGRGRGGASFPIEITATGPFAMGPTAQGSGQARRSARGADFTPTVPAPVAKSTVPGENLTRTAAPTLKGLDKGKTKVKEEEEIYSDPDDGVEIIDMNKIKDMDWMAPEALLEEKKHRRAKKERELDALDPKNALDVSESEDEEEPESLIDDFASKSDMDADRLYFFQFPSPFPKFTKPNEGLSSSGSVGQGIVQEPGDSSAKRVSFAPDTKPAVTPSSSRPSTAPPEHTTEQYVDGVIGQLEIYKSGAVKIRLINGTLLDVNAATQPSFLQQAVHLDMNNKRLIVLGQVNKQFVVSPDIDSLLEATELKQQLSGLLDVEGADQLLMMDTVQ